MRCLNTSSLEPIVMQLRDRVKSDIAMVNFVDENSQQIMASSGFELPDDMGGMLPLEYSICVHTKAMDFPLVVDDAQTHPLLKGNLSVIVFGVQAYVGVPVHLPEHGAIGAICVLERHARRWEENEIQAVMDAARQVDAKISEIKAR